MSPTTSISSNDLSSPVPPSLPEPKAQAATTKPQNSVSDEKYRSLKKAMESNHIKSLFIGELKKISDRVVTAFPAEEYLYIGVGRSPATLIAELQGRFGKDAACNLPLSDFKFLGICTSGDKVRYKQKPTQEERVALFRHFDKFLGSGASNRKVLVMDYIGSGSTILSASYFFHQYFKEQGSAFIVNPVTGISERKVHVLALGGRQSSKEITACRVNLMKAIQPKPSARSYRQGDYDYDYDDDYDYACGFGFESVLHFSSAKGFAEYNTRVTVADLAGGMSEKKLCRNPLYDLLVDYLRATDHEDAPKELFSQWVLYREHESPCTQSFSAHNS